MKARLLAVLLVSSLVLASMATVALAQVTVSGDNNTSVQYVDCSQVQAAANVQYGDQNAAANDNSTAEIANKLHTSQSQVNACLGGQPDDGNKNDGNDDDGDKEDEDANTEANNLEDGKDDVLAGTDPGGTLPETGGPSLLAIGAGLVLVAGGASLIRFRR